MEGPFGVLKNSGSQTFSRAKRDYHIVFPTFSLAVPKKPCEQSFGVFENLHVFLLQLHWLVGLHSLLAWHLFDWMCTKF